MMTLDTPNVGGKTYYTLVNNLITFNSNISCNSAFPLRWLGQVNIMHNHLRVFNLLMAYLSQAISYKKRIFAISGNNLYFNETRLLPSRPSPTGIIYREETLQIATARKGWITILL